MVQDKDIEFSPENAKRLLGKWNSNFTGLFLPCTLSYDRSLCACADCMCTCRRASARSRPTMMTSSAGYHPQRCPESLPLNLVQRPTPSSCRLKSPHHTTSCQQPMSLVTSSEAATSGSKPRCFECSLCGKRFKVQKL